MLMSPRPNHDVLRAHGGDGNCAQMVAVVVVMVAAILADVRTGPLVIRPKVAPLQPVVPMSGKFLNDYGDRPVSEQFRSAPRTCGPPCGRLGWGGGIALDGKRWVACRPGWRSLCACFVASGR